MNIFKIGIRNIVSRPLSAILTLVMLTMGVALVSVLLQAGSALDEGFRKNIRGIDMVVGAKGSPLQLILSAIYQIDNPTGNISRGEAQKLAGHPQIKHSIQLAYGDSYKGRRIVGSSHAYPALYDLKIAHGRLWEKTFEVTIGHQVAAEFGLKVGDQFYSAHGLDSSAEVHDDFPFTVVGIFEPSGTAPDRLLLTSLESIWEVHPSPADTLGGNKEITAMLVQFKNKMGMLTLPRYVNKETSMQAALPSIEINRLFDLFGMGIAVLRILAVVIMLLGAISIFVSMLNTLKDRAEEIALIRALGASRAQVFGMVLLESIVLGIAGYFLGLFLAHFGLFSIQEMAASDYGMQIEAWSVMLEELWLLMAIVLLCLLAALLPAIITVKMDISKVLANYAH